MANEKHIIVLSGLKPTHSFDLYGPILNTEQLGEQSIEHFQQITEHEKISPEETTKIINDYRALLKGEPWTTGELKNGIIDAIKKPLAKYPDLKVNYQSGMYEDGLLVMKDILDCSEGVIIFSSKSADWLKVELPPYISERIGTIYGSPKLKPEAFIQVYNSELNHGHRVVTHTADETPELEAAVSSGIFSGHQGKLIFVNRNDQISCEQVMNLGIDYYVNDLREVPYSKFVRKYDS